MLCRFNGACRVLSALTLSVTRHTGDECARCSIVHPLAAGQNDPSVGANWGDGYAPNLSTSPTNFFNTLMTKPKLLAQTVLAPHV